MAGAWHDLGRLPQALMKCAFGAETEERGRPPFLAQPDPSLAPRKRRRLTRLRLRCSDVLLVSHVRRSLLRGYFFEFLGGSSRINDQETSAVSPVSYSILKCVRNLFGTLTRIG